MSTTVGGRFGGGVDARAFGAVDGAALALAIADPDGGKELVTPEGAAGAVALASSCADSRAVGAVGALVSAVGARSGAAA